MSQIEKLTSSDNAKVKLAKEVRDGRDKSRIFVEGARLLRELISSDLQIELCFYTRNAKTDPNLSYIFERLIKLQVNMYEISDKLLRSMSDTVSPQGMIVIANRKERSISGIKGHLLRSISDRLPLWLFLFEINNPSNLGAILRTAYAAGAAGVIVSAKSTDAFSPKSIRASMGTAFELPIYENATAREMVNICKEIGMKASSADVNASRDYTQINWKQPRLLVFGSEAHGVSDEILSLMDETFKIPMQNSVESLNLAVSAGIILFEARRQAELG